MEPTSGTGVTHRILIVEDERMTRAATEQVLVKLGYDTMAVASGTEAVASYAAGEFDAILMDCQMPEMDGFRATAAIRRSQEVSGRARTPIIGLSGRNMDGDSEAAIAAGMDSYLVKPIRAEVLRATLERWLEGSSPS